MTQWKMLGVVLNLMRDIMKAAKCAEINHPGTLNGTIVYLVSQVICYRRINVLQF